MNRRPLWRLLVILIFVLVGATVMVGSYARYNNYQGGQRPDFTLPAMSGGKQSIAKWDGKVVVLNFWATWCEPCRREIPLLSKLQKKYGPRGLQVIGVAVDSREAIGKFTEKVNINYPILYGTEAAMAVAASYGDKQETLPYTVVIGRNGLIQHIFRKEIKRPDLEPVVRGLL